MRTWTDLSMSSIYKLLQKLEKQKLVTAQTEQTAENRLRKVYSLSDMGKTAFKATLFSMLSNHVVSKNPFDVGIYFSSNLAPEELKNGLSKYKNQLEKKIQGYKDLWKFLKDDDCPEGPRGLALRTVAMLEGELKWLTEHIEDLS